MRKVGPPRRSLDQPIRLFMSCEMLASFKASFFCLADTAMDLFLQDFLSEQAAFGDCFLSPSLSSSPPPPVPTSAFIFLRV